MLVVVLAAVGAVTCSGTASASVDVSASTLYADRAVARGFVALYGRHPSTASRAYWYPRLVETPDAVWFALLLMDTQEYRGGLGRSSDAAFVRQIYVRGARREPTASEQGLWEAAFRNGSQNRATMTGWAIETQFGPRLVRPPATVPCSTFDRGGVAPRCERAGAGTQRDVSILRIPGTNIYVNRAWYQEVTGLLARAEQAGYQLGATRDPAVPAWMLSPGSWRSWDDQQWLYDHGYPANRPGKSMHEWGLAIDVACNGLSIVENRPCWDWVRANGPAFHIRLFAKVVAITSSEAWHFSSNGL
ncbi:MAG: hypothetical protein JWM47_274 [Acidimicrobiales bacterium]|nr:hypothetical protein [Acidimicrobiales bacterium]